MEDFYDIRILKTDPNYLKYQENYSTLLTNVRTKKIKCFISRSGKDARFDAKLVIADNSFYVKYICLMSIGGFVMRYYEDNKMTKYDTDGNVFALLILKWIQLDIESSPSLYDILTTWTPQKINDKIIFNESFEDNPPPCTDEDLYG